MYNEILEVLEEVACNNTGSCQINLQSESARAMIADKITQKIQPELDKIIEDIVVGRVEEYEAQDE